MNKQIEEMAKVLCNHCAGKEASCSVAKSGAMCMAIQREAEALYNAGYRKQSEGEWIKDEKSKFKHRYHCTACDFYLIGAPKKHCPGCGAWMGVDEG